MAGKPVRKALPLDPLDMQNSQTNMEGAVMGTQTSAHSVSPVFIYWFL